MLSVSSLSVSHIGKVRTHNEDALYSDDEQGVWLVADGMGGHASGEVASAMAIETISSAVNNKDALDNAITSAHQKILQQGTEQPEKKGMGTTIVAAKANKTGFDIAWVGDSRIYLHTHKLEQVSVDHTFVQDLIHREVLTQEEAINHPQRNLIISSLGMEQGRFQIGTAKVHPKSSGTLFLCSDGVTDYLPDSELYALFEQSDSMDELAAQIESAILDTQAGDNFSFILIGYTLRGYEKWCNKLKFSF